MERELTLILGRLDDFAARIKTGLHEADWLTRREIIRALAKRVEIDQEQVHVVFRVNPPPQAPQLPSEKDSQSLQHCGRRGESRFVQYPAQQARQVWGLWCNGIEKWVKADCTAQSACRSSQ
jgi:hypothetical protein